VPLNKRFCGSWPGAVPSFRSVGPPGGGGGGGEGKGRKDPYKNFTMEVKMLTWARKKSTRNRNLFALTVVTVQ
jgi:hypothetical protein